MRAENIEFIALFEASGWTKAETARRLDLDRSSVGKFVAGAIAPSSQTLKLFKLILASENPNALTGTSGEPPKYQTWEQKVIHDLTHLSDQDRERVLNVMRAMINDLPKKQYTAAQAATLTGSSSVNLSEGERKLQEELAKQGGRGHHRS